jgi:hypothetical protein
MVVPAPGRFSTTTGCAHIFDSRSPIARAATSLDAPAGAGTTRRTGLAGHSSIEKAAEPHSVKTPSTKYFRMIVSHWSATKAARRTQGKLRGDILKMNC